MILLAVALAAVFGWAGVAKLRRRAATVSSFAAFGLPAPASLAVAVPVTELMVAVLLVLRPVIGATLALAALAGFTTQLVLARRRGVDTGCGCFGGVQPAGPNVELVRNGVLAVAALAIVLAA